MSNNKEFEFKLIKQIKTGHLYSINTKDNEYLYIETPFMSVPFGVEKYYQDTILKLQFDDTKNQTNDKMMDFYNFIKNVEQQIKEEFIEQYKDSIVDIDNMMIKTQIVNKNKYDDLLMVKFNKKYHNIDICKENGEIQNIYNIDKNSIIKCNLYINNIWVDNSVISYKLNINKITIKNM